MRNTERVLLIVVKVVGSRFTECIIVLLLGTFFCVRIDGGKRGSVLARFDENIDEHKKLRSGNAEPLAHSLRDKNEGTYQVGKR